MLLHVCKKSKLFTTDCKSDQGFLPGSQEQVCSLGSEHTPDNTSSRPQTHCLVPCKEGTSHSLNTLASILHPVQWKHWLIWNSPLRQALYTICLINVVQGFHQWPIIFKNNSSVIQLIRISNHLYTKSLNQRKNIQYWYMLKLAKYH